MKSVADQHAVPHALSAYISQLDTALDWLSEGSLSASVGVETLDDIAKIDANDAQLGQSKLSFCRNPLSDQSQNLWGTIDTWLQMIDAGERDVENDRFLFISNFDIKSQLVTQLKQANLDGKKLSGFVKLLRRTGMNISGKVQAIATRVLRHQDDDLIRFFSRVRVADNCQIDPDAQLRSLQAKLHLSDEIAKDVIQGLRGWVQEKVQSELVQRRPAWIKREVFCDELHRLVSRHQNRTFYLKAVRDFVISEAERGQHQDAMFVQQLRLIGIEDCEDEMLEAINDFLMSASERTRLSIETNITRKVLDSFETQLIERWKPLHRQHKRTKGSPEDRGYDLYCKVLDHREPLDGHSTDEFYFTRGTYHHLANAELGTKPKLGWHPDFDKLI